MTECPELGTLEAPPLVAAVQSHVDSCESCQLVVELFEQARGIADAERDCMRFDALLAARSDGTLGTAAANLLQRHLAGCTSCREVADTLSPGNDRDGDHTTLPSVEPEAYELGLEIGRGGMGRILAARDVRIGRPVAIKELLGRSPRHAARFEREARVTARLQHPGIVPIYEIGRWPDDTPFYSMRMYEGRTLREAIEQAGSLAERIALLPSVIAAAETVAFAHGQRIIHRDLTPSNVMVGAYGETVVIDWGLAKDLAASGDGDGDSDGDLDPDAELEASRSDERLTAQGAVLGTAAYMPPEQARSSTVDERADVYALGAILYHLLAGVAPYHARTRSSLLDELKAGPPQPVDQIARDQGIDHAPRDLISIVSKAMARDPAARYPSARELADELKRFQTGRIVEAHEYTTRERIVRFIARNRVPVMVTAIALVLLGILGTVAVRRVLRERKVAEGTVLTLLEEEGRVELLGGSSLRALAYLESAFEGTRQPSPALRFLRAMALHDVSAIEGDLDCGGAVRDLEFSPDGATLAVMCADHARLWRIADRTQVLSLGPAPDGFFHLAYSHDGATIATWGSDGRVRTWDTTTGQLRQTFVHRDDVEISFATFTPDDSVMSTSGYDGWAKLWNARTGELLRSIHGSTGPLLDHLYALLTHDGKRLMTLTIDGTANGWDVATGERLDSREHGSITVGGSVWSRGPLAVTCGMNRLVKVWDTETGKLVVQFAGATDVVWTCRFSEDGKYVLGTSHDHHAYVWDVASGAAVTTVDHGSPVWTGHWARNGRTFVTLSLEGRNIKLWNAATGELLASHDTQGGREARVSPDGALLVAGLGDGRVRVWRARAGALHAGYVAPPDADVLAVTADGGRVATLDAGVIAVRDPSTDQQLGPTDLKAPVAAGGARMVATGTNNTLHVIESDGRTVATLKLDAIPMALWLTADGNRVIVELLEHDVEVWDVARQVRVATLTGARHARLSDDGRRAIAWGGEASPSFWDVDGQRQLAALRPEALSPTALAVPALDVIGFAAGASRVVVEIDTAGARSAIVLDAATGKQIAAIHDLRARSAIDPSGTFLTTLRANHHVETWSVLGALDRPRTAFVSDVQQAQVDPHGDLIAGVDKSGETVVVLAATDGRILSRWRIGHDSPIVSQDSYDPPHATVQWSPDGKRIIAQSTTDAVQRLTAAVLGARPAAHVAVFDTDTELRDDREIAALIARNVPWRVVDGRLVPALATLAGRVVRNGVPVTRATFTLVFSKPPEYDGEIMRSSVLVTNTSLAPLKVDAFGNFRRELPPGRYTLTIEEAGTPLHIDLAVGDGPRVLDLAH